MNKCILIIDDDQDFNELLKGIFEQAGYTVHTAFSADQGFQMLEQSPIELIVSDHRLPGGITGTEFLAKLRERGIDLPVIIVSGFLNDEAIRELIRDGVAGIFIKPLNIFSLLKKSLSVLEERAKALAGTGEETPGPAILKSIGYIEGASSEGKAFLKRARQAAGFRRNLLLIGPTGTLFEGLARDIIALAPEAQRSLVVGPGSVSADRLKGLFEGEEGGKPLTLVVNDAEKLSSEEVEIVVDFGDQKGGSESLLRMIFCLSQPVEELYDNEIIDEDLYLFLGANELQVPSLKQMPEDLVAIAKGLLEKDSQEGVFDMKLRTLILAHDWPENMVELRSVMVRAITLAQPMAPKLRHFEAAINPGESTENGLNDVSSTFERFLIQEKRRYEAANDLIFESQV